MMTEYGQAQVTKNEAREDEAFHSLLGLLEAHGITEFSTRQEVIRLWVQGTHSYQAIGWHRGYDAGKGV